jgi:hypothetical protein
MLLFVKLDHFKELLQSCDIILSFIMKTTSQYQSQLNLTSHLKCTILKSYKMTQKKDACLKKNVWEE